MFVLEKEYRGPASGPVAVGAGRQGPGCSPGVGEGEDDVRSLPWDIGHITPLPARRAKGFLLKSGHSVIDLKGFGAQAYEGERGWSRGEVTTWSRQSRARLMKSISAINWESLRLFFVVLTWGKQPPSDGKEAHEAVEAFWKAWNREYGSRPAGVWKKEFQKRGVIHYSMWLTQPIVAGSQPIVAENVNKFVHETWYRIAGYGDLNHLIHGSHCQEFVGSPLQYLLKECFAANKEYQNVPPLGFHTGRWWGFIGGLKPIWDEQELTIKQGVKVRRLLRGYLRSKGYRGRIRSTIHGVWASMLPETRVRILRWVKEDL